MQTVDDLVTEVREQVDETNQSTKDDDAIVRLFNRGQRIINRVLATHYPDPILTSTSLDTGTNGTTHTIPKDCFGDKVVFIQVDVPGSPSETFRRGVRDRARLTGTTAIPFSWNVEGRRVKFQQTPTGTYDATMWYTKRLDKLVKKQGRITAVGSNYVNIDATGADLSQSSDSNSSYINIIDFQTGEIKGSFQIASIVNRKVTLRASALRSTVEGRTISASTALATCGAAVDDYICLVHGTCVPQFQDTTAGYLVQFAVEELTKSLGGGDARLEQQILNDYKEDAEAAWAGQEQAERVRNRSGVWPHAGGRIWPSSGS
jgi:hypothetical protein